MLSSERDCLTSLFLNDNLSLTIIRQGSIILNIGSKLSNRERKTARPVQAWQSDTTRYDATGCHFTGPIALRRRISPGLPTLKLFLFSCRKGRYKQFAWFNFQCICNIEKNLKRERSNRVRCLDWTKVGSTHFCFCCKLFLRHAAHLAKSSDFDTKFDKTIPVCWWNILAHRAVLLSPLLLLL